MRWAGPAPTPGSWGGQREPGCRGPSEGTRVPIPGLQSQEEEASQNLTVKPSGDSVHLGGMEGP